MLIVSGSMFHVFEFSFCLHGRQCVGESLFNRSRQGGAVILFRDSLQEDTATRCITVQVSLE